MREIYPRFISTGRIDEGKLKSIADRPFFEVYGYKKYDTIYKQAACLMEGIIRLHPFPDGNKRTAFLATCVFLHMNKHYIVVPLNSVEFMVGIANSEARTDEEIDSLIDGMASWIEARTATNAKEFDKITRRYVPWPTWKMVLLACTGLGLIYVMKTFRRWFALDMHPEYAKDMKSTMKLMFGILYLNRQASQSNT